MRMESKTCSKKDSRPLCATKTKSGLQCRGHVVKGSKFCNLHDPRWAGKVAAGRKRGGRIPRAKVLAKELKQIGSFDDLLAFLNKLIHDLYSGRLNPKAGQTIVSALGGMKSTLESMGITTEQKPPVQVTIIPAGPLEEQKVEMLPEPPEEEKKHLAEVIPLDRKPLESPERDEIEKTHTEPLGNIETPQESQNYSSEDKKPTVAWIDSPEFWYRITGNPMEFDD